ncbi:hypothetical protein [Moraxella nasicaprae]|uniref:Uncharacterized protein n=1 Tax=Moraxella nasicaprae TaxID=2904122 RepID=A0ABY6F371_9GAMM|nr:hypothetical protein [Moraxella nasicaprae]UXZ04539.1 hypothetical protein LU297_08125 [Moraxella nasicaprae]
MSNLSLNVSLKLSDELTAKLEKAVQPAKELADKFSDLKEQAEQLKVPNLNTNSLDKFQHEVQSVIEKTQDLHKKIHQLGTVKEKLGKMNDLLTKNGTGGAKLSEAQKKSVPTSKKPKSLSSPNKAHHLGINHVHCFHLLFAEFTG